MIRNNEAMTLKAKDMPRVQYVHNENRRESNQFGTFFKNSQIEGMEYCDYVMKVQESSNIAANKKILKDSKNTGKDYCKKAVKLSDKMNQNGSKGRLSLKSNLVSKLQSKVKLEVKENALNE